MDSDKQLITPRHVACLLDEKEVFKHQRIIAELKLEPTGNTEPHYKQRRQRKRNRSALGGKPERECKPDAGQEVEESNPVVFKITVKHFIGAQDGGKTQRQHAETQRGRNQQQRK